MCTQELKIGTIPAVLYGEPAPNIWLFVHGQGGNKTEAAAFAALAAPTGWQVLGIDLPEHGDRTGETDFTPWQVVPELQTVLAYLQQHWQGIRLRANSIGCNLVRRTEKGRLRRRGWGLRWEKAQKGGKGTNLRGFFED